VSAPGQSTERFPEATLPTQLTRDRLNENFAPPETIGFWQIPAYVEVLEVAGLPTERLKLQFHRLLAMPLLFAAMVVIAATFALRPPRRGGVTFVIAVGVAVGFVLYFLSNFVFALGLSGKLPLILAAWTPTTVCLMLGVTTLLHLEDG
jgi:lipopolysaccharide export system permease protein